MNYKPPIKVQIDASLFLDLYILTNDLANGAYADLMDAELDAAELLPEMLEKYNAMLSRKEYAERLGENKKRDD